VRRLDFAFADELAAHLARSLFALRKRRCPRLRRCIRASFDDYVKL